MNFLRFLPVRMEPVHALLFTGLAAGMRVSHLLVRPHVIGWLLAAVWVGVTSGMMPSF
jgi:hypothetical protein